MRWPCEKAQCQDRGDGPARQAPENPAPLSRGSPKRDSLSFPGISPRRRSRRPTYLFRRDVITFPALASALVLVGRISGSGVLVELPSDSHSALGYLLRDRQD